MARLSREQLNDLKEKYNVDRIWSWSRLNTYVEQPFAYYMAYIHPDRVRTDNVYTYWGSLAHDLIQDYYDGKYKLEDLNREFKERVTEWRLSYSDMYRFMNDNVELSYINNLDHYFDNVNPIKFKIKNEVPVDILVKNKNDNTVFIGYIDSIFVDDEKNIHIMDYKTSSISGYSGKKLLDNSKQLLLYAIGIYQKYNVPFEKIKLNFDMMKYVKISYLQKNGKWKDTIKERTKIIESQDTKIRKILDENEYDIFEIEKIMDKALSENSFDSLPDCVKEKFKLDSAVINVPYDESTIEELKEWIVKYVNECVEKESGDHEKNFPQPRLYDDGNEFYYTVLARQLLPYIDDYKLAQESNDLTDDEWDNLDELFK